jgi:hypothetical protein
MLQIFHGSATGSLDQLHAIKIMTDCLRHHSMKIMTGKNQMTYKTHQTNNLYVQAMLQFCSLENISEIVQHLVLESNLHEEASDLVRAMLQIASSQEADTDKLLLNLLKATEKLKIGKVSKLFIRVNSTILFKAANPGEWFKKLSAVT